MRLYFFYSAVRENSKLDLSDTEGAIGSVRIKVARPSIFVGTPSTFESLILKQIYLHCKTFITYLLHID